MFSFALVVCTIQVCHWRTDTRIITGPDPGAGESIVTPSLMSSRLMEDPIMSAPRILATADIDDGAQIGDGTSVWHLAQVRVGAVVGRNCIIGRGAYIGDGARLGDNCKVQNYALVYEPAVLGDGVFIGPAAVLTNDEFPRAVNADGSPKNSSDWHSVGVEVGEGAAIGARAVCVAPVRVGAWATVAAGAVVTRDVPDFALVLGVPARRVGWVGHAGVPLTDIGNGMWRCPTTGAEYVEQSGVLIVGSDV